MRYFYIVYNYVINNSSFGHGSMFHINKNYPPMTELINFITNQLTETCNSIPHIVITNIIELKKRDWLALQSTGENK